MTSKSFLGTIKHMKSRSRIIAGILVCLLVMVMAAVYLPELVNAQSSAAATPQAQTSGDLYTPRYLPPIVQGAQGPGDLVFLIYKYLMGLVGIVAVGVIIYGGVLRTISADPGKIKVSNEYIKNAIKGIVLLFGAQVIFNTINPNIIDIARIQRALQPKERLTPQQFIQAAIGIPEDATSTAPATNQQAANVYGGLPGFATLAAKIQPCSNCQAIGFGSGFQVKNGACVGQTCYLNSELTSTLRNLGTIAQASNIQWRVTEAYPPTVNHQSTCHFNGTCVDIGLTGGVSAAKVNAFINAARAAGLTVVNEYSVGANPQSFSTTTGGHLHVRL